MRVVTMLVVAVVAAGCSGGPEATDLGEVTSKELALMVLPPSALGEAGRGLELDAEESGPQTAADAAYDTTDPEDTAEDLKARGYVEGYDLGVFTTDLGARGRLGAGGGVLLFETAEQARSFVGDLFDYDLAHEGVEIESGIILTSVVPFDVDGIGDEASGIVEAVEIGDSSAVATLVAVAVGQVVGGITILRTDDEDVTDDARSLAEALAERIEGVASGEITGRPVPIPGQEAGIANVDEDPTLEPLALALADLPDGTRVVREEFVDSEGDTAFEREFGFRAGTAVGSSQLLNLEVNVERHETAADAQLFMDFLADFLSGPDLGAILAENAGFEVTDPDSVTARRIEAPGVGDRAIAIESSFHTSLGSIETVAVYLTEGRVAGQLYAVATEGKVDPVDVLALARTFAKRMSRDAR